MPEFLRRYWYQAVLIGQESGDRHDLSGLMSFRHFHDAVLWVLEQNASNGTEPLTVWRVEEIPTKIRYVPGIPRWFAWALHHVSVRRCRRIGHQGAVVCEHCGLVLDPGSPTLWVYYQGPGR